MAPVESEAGEPRIEAKPIMESRGADSKPAVRQTSKPCLLTLMIDRGTIQIPKKAIDACETDGAHGAATCTDERVYDHPRLPDLKLPSRKSRISAALWKHLPKRYSKPRAPPCPPFRLLSRKSPSKISPAPNIQDADFPQTTGIVPFFQDDAEKNLEMENVLNVAGMPVEADILVSNATCGTPVGNAKSKTIDQIAVVEEC
jgi:hypothetical protein